MTEPTEPTDPTTSGTGGTAAAVPDHAVRQILKATLVPLTVDAPLGGLAKATHAYVRQLGVQPGEVAAARRFADDGHPPRADVNWGLLAAFDTAQVPSQLPSAADFSAVPATGLRAFGELLQQMRAAATALAAPSPYAPTTSAARSSTDPPVPPPAPADVALARILLNRVVVAILSRASAHLRRPGAAAGS